MCLKATNLSNEDIYVQKCGNLGRCETEEELFVDKNGTTLASTYHVTCDEIDSPSDGEEDVD